MAFAVDRKSLERDCDLSFFVAGGPGGQNRNKVSTGVRLVHRPSGIVIAATERRSQSANREMAFERLAERLIQMQQVRAKRVATKPSAAVDARRREEKRLRGERKQLRRTIHFE